MLDQTDDRHQGLIENTCANENQMELAKDKTKAPKLSTFTKWSSEGSEG